MLRAFALISLRSGDPPSRTAPRTRPAAASSDQRTASAPMAISSPTCGGAAGRGAP